MGPGVRAGKVAMWVGNKWRERGRSLGMVVEAMPVVLAEAEEAGVRACSSAERRASTDEREGSVGGSSGEVLGVLAATDAPGGQAEAGGACEDDVEDIREDKLAPQS